ncbi:MAG: FAD binding domain-containing protein [Candidatus Cloacimonetes bacterium]|nr:FAD binding domain-containing protein [Candidatus Cloacimonadota bacterium]
MQFNKPKDLNELLENLSISQKKNYFLAGGTDINVQIKKEFIKDGNFYYINEIDELNGIKRKNEKVHVGALTTYRELLESDTISEHFPFLQRSLTNFASPLLTTMATIGGNIANGSPTNDVTPPLLVLDAELELISVAGIRNVSLTSFFTGYKKSLLKKDEIIKGVVLSIQAENGYETLYKKVGARKTLTIAKVALAGLKKIKEGKIDEIKLAVGSLNEYPRRLDKLEEYLNNIMIRDINKNTIDEILSKEITPISDLRSDKEYRYRVCLNLILSFLGINH